MATEAYLTIPPVFWAFLSAVHNQHKIPELARSNVRDLPTIALDPGETTGVAEFDGRATIKVYQEETKELGPSYEWLCGRLEDGPEHTHTMPESLPPPPFQHLRYEDYRVYEWKAADHAWSQVHTLRWIGAILVAAYKKGIDYSPCLAQHAKAFWTDDKLKHFGLYTPGLKHGRDALRHLLYYMCFPTKAD